jgi:opacity protein-like surface antigen
MPVVSTEQGRRLGGAASRRTAAAVCRGFRHAVSWLGLLATLGTALSAAATPEPIDLSALDDLAATQATPASVWDDVSLAPVSITQPGRSCFYVTGMLGQSFATLTDPLYGGDGGGRINGLILTAGGAAGVAFAREDGQWRFEVEGRGRDDLTRTVMNRVSPAVTTNVHWAAADGWSAMANVWRDWWIGERWGAYLGGGLGGGGYRYSLDGDIAFFAANLDVTGNAQVAEFAWQAGAGVVYELTERVSFDAGYRFFSIGRSDTTYSISSGGVPLVSTTLAQQLTAGEVLFALRVYEPFRRWR